MRTVEESIRGLCGSKVEVVKSEVGDIIIDIIDSRDTRSVMRLLRDHSGLMFKCIVDMTCVDRGSGMEIVYELLSVSKVMRVRVKSSVEGEIETISDIFKGADWLEREVYDMFGVFFIGHKDLRRLLTDYGFKGNALRKDFRGAVEVKYDEEKKCVVVR